MIKPLQTRKSTNIVTSEFALTSASSTKCNCDREMNTRHSTETNENSPDRLISNARINQLSLEQVKKVNFRQRIRNLREMWEDGPLLASTEDIVDAEDNDGFILASRTKKGRKIKSAILASSPDNNSNSLVMDSILTCDTNISISEQTSSENEALTLIRDQDPEMKNHEFNNLSSKVDGYTSKNLDDLSCEEVSEVEAQKQKLDHSEEMNCELKKMERKSPWYNKTESTQKRVMDFNECSICYQPWTEDKVILEECGHCFHSQCIRLWMKRKNTCPFCATFSLLLDEFPKLT